MNLSRVEQETIILFNEADETADIDVSNSALRRKMERIRADRPEEVQLIRESDYSAVYTFPKSWMRITPKRILTDEQREQMGEIAKSNLHRKSPS